MMKKTILSWGILLMLGITSCNVLLISTSTNNSNSIGNQEGLNIFPKHSSGYIGDPMPFYDNGIMNIFYLHDARDGKKGFHPWYLLQTNDFVSFKDRGEAIPYVNDYSSQDLALGTGSVIKDKEGIYHAFYTGYNGTGNMPYFEKIQHAISNDLVNWQKLPQDGFYGGLNDFRDPYVLYMESEGLYWMLITSRHNNRGVIKIFKSENLTSWVDNGIFFTSDIAGLYNMECPTLIKFNGYWYLFFSEQGNNRVLHYRYTNDLTKGWIRPNKDYFDGIGFYAGRVEHFKDRLIATGWVGTKNHDYDMGDFNWAGNLVNHELYALNNGELRVKMVKEVDEVLSNKFNYQIYSQSKNLQIQNNEIIFNSKNGYDFVNFSKLDNNTLKVEFSFMLSSKEDRFGLNFAVDDEMGKSNILFDPQNNQVLFYDDKPGSFNKFKIKVDFLMEVNTKYQAKLVIENECLTLYLNEDMALTSRVYAMKNKPFGFYSLRSGVKLTDLQFFK